METTGTQSADVTPATMEIAAIVTLFCLTQTIFTKNGLMLAIFATLTTVLKVQKKFAPQLRPRQQQLLLLPQQRLKHRLLIQLKAGFTKKIFLIQILLTTTGTLKSLPIPTTTNISTILIDQKT